MPTSAGSVARHASMVRAQLDTCAKRATPLLAPALPSCRNRRKAMNGIIYLVGLIVVVMFILSFLGLR
jgi:hypothetical protein